MTRQRLDHAAELTDGMRGPLARIQLAASELERAAATPRERELLSRIAHAVVELDGLAQAVEGVLRPRVRSGEVVELGPVLEDLHEHLAPAVAARGFVWLPLRLPASTVVGDPSRARHAAIALLGAACAEPAPRAELRLALAQDADRYGVGLDLESDGDPIAAERIEAAAGEARSLALSRGGALDIECRGDRASLTLWWPADLGCAA